MTIDGLTTIASASGPEETMHRLETAVLARGMTVFARINHAAGARQEGLALRPTDLLIFGNARAGTPLMQAAQTIGIDLPLKVLVWLDESDKTWLSYYDISGAMKRHGIGADGNKAGEAIAATLSAVSMIAAQASSTTP